ncbi:metallophosphoesterase family protein [bacterium]|nr:metallophosphoesterase family protein [bacterium]
MSERIAFISDLHSNLEALKAVLADIDSKRVKKIVCLGDVIGYGPDPNPVIDIARRSFSLVIEGNHDEAVGRRIPSRFKRIAARAALWTRKQLKPRLGAKNPTQSERWRYVRTLPATHRIGDWLLAHGSPISNMDYVTEKIEALMVFDRDMDDARACFLGHTHIPGIFVLEGEEQVHYVPAVEGKRFKVAKRKMIVNVGSVGQPRDGDNRACWVLARDDGSFSFRRVPYEIEKTADKISKAGLHKSLAQRLFVGE